MTETPDLHQNETATHLLNRSNLNCETLKDLCVNNAAFFENDKSECGQRLKCSFVTINEVIENLWPIVLELRGIAPKFDFDEKTPGNGCRSFLIALDYAIIHGIQINKKVCYKRHGVLFRKTSITREVEAYSNLVGSLQEYGNYLKILMSWTKNDELFCNASSLADLIHDDVNLQAFYGRNLGFQFYESMRPILRFVSLSMVIFSEAYYSRGSFFSKARNSVTTTAKYITDPEERAKRIVNIYRNANVDFCKAFWFLSETELMKQVPTVIGQNVAVSKVIQIPPEELILRVDDREIEVPIPNSYLGKRPVQVRLISHDVREGMIGEGQTKNKVLPPSRGLLIHCHGGGFISQSSMSHDSYLREWAKELDVPILSIDYSLAPQAPFPRAFEEVIYAYCWARKNHVLLGSTGERIVVAGDSAGGNLLMATTLRLIDMGITPPTGLFMAYTPMWLSVSPTPSRMLCLFDPLLPLGFITRCLRAYVLPHPPKLRKFGAAKGENGSDTESFEEISQSDLVELQAHKSPTSEASDTITYGSLNSPVDAVDDLKTTRRDLDISEIDVNVSDCDQSTSQNVNVSDFLERYVLDSDTETDGTKVITVQQESVSLQQPNQEYSLQNKISSFVTGIRERIGGWVGATPSEAEVFLDADRDRTNYLDLFNFEAPTDPFLSPYLAPDELLKQLPAVKFLSLNMDPCLDDCVMFSKKLRKLGNDVTLDVLDGLPHGFLNLTLVSKECTEGSKICMKRIIELMSLDSLPPLQPTIINE